jgi:tetratricopeptide (TPR) repeat protein
MGAIEEWFGRQSLSKSRSRWIIYIVCAAILSVPVAIWLRSVLQARGIRVEPFSVSQNFAKKELSGEGVAELLVAKLNEAYAKVNSRHYVQSLNDDIADEIKIEIPETGTTFGDLNRYMRDLLGHETHIIGVVYESGEDLTIDVVVGTKTCQAARPSASGEKPDLDVMMEELSKCILAETQPYLGAIYQAKLDAGTADDTKNEADKKANDAYQEKVRSGSVRPSSPGPEQAREVLVSADALAADTNKQDSEIKARAVYESLTHSIDPVERAWAYAALGDGIAKSSRDKDGAAIEYGITMLHRAAAILPNFAIAQADIATHEASLGHDEAAVAAQMSYSAMLQHGSAADLSESSIAELSSSASSRLDLYVGNFQAVAQDFSGADCFDPDDSCADEIVAVIGTHDTLLARKFLARRQRPLSWSDALPLQSACDGQGFLDNDARWNFNNALFAFRLAIAEENWPEVLKEADGARASYSSDPNCKLAWRVQIDRYAAIAEAKMGYHWSAEKLVRATPSDCYQCMIARARVYAADGKLGAAQFWLKSAVASGTRLPFALQTWGEVLLEDAHRKGGDSRKEIDTAIKKFSDALMRNPHFADAEERWGEGLMALNRSDLALAEFQEADEFAPNWGRLHLKWGEALYYSGHRDSARAQFATAQVLYLPATERDELQWELRKHAGGQHN